MEEEFLKIVNHYGISNQLKYIHSEYFELDEAILYYESDDYYDIEHETDLKQHIAEEIADVMVMLKQFQYYYDIEEEEIEDVMKYKVQRQIERIEKE